MKSILTITKVDVAVATWRLTSLKLLLFLAMVLPR